jgi:lipocalin
MAYQYFTNVPQSVRIATAKKIRPGESIGDYAKRVSLAYEKESMFDREMKAVLTKYMFSDEEGKMTLFNKAYDKAREWEKIKKDEAKKNTGKWKELAGLDSDNSLTMLYKLVDNGMGQYKKAVKNGIDFSDEDKKTAMETYRKNVLALVEKINGKK